MKKIYVLGLLLIGAIGVNAQNFTNVNTGTSNLLTTVYFFDAKIGFTAGPNGVILNTTDAGQTWKSQVSGVKTEINDFYFFTKDIGIASGRAGVILRTTNGGSTWKKINSGVLTDLARLSSDGKNVFSTGYKGVVLKSTDQGLTWSKLNTRTSTNFFGIAWTSKSIGFIAGDGGTIMKTTTGGASWNKLFTGSSYQLLSIVFTDPNHGYAVGGSGKGNIGAIVSTTDAGKTWTQKTFSGTFFGNVRFVDASTGYIAGGHTINNTSTIHKTADSGKTWTIQKTNNKRQFGLGFASYKLGYSVGLDGSMIRIHGKVTTNNTISLKEDLMIYPNPTTGVVNIDLPNTKNANIQVFNNQGALILEEQNKSKIELSAFPTGVYMVKITVDQNTITKKIVLQ